MESHDAPVHDSPDVPWLKRILLVAVFGFTILIFLTAAQALTSMALRTKLNERDAAWQKRLDGLESEVIVMKNSVVLMQKAKTKQDEFNATVIKILGERHADRSTH